MIRRRRFWNDCVSKLTFINGLNDNMKRCPTRSWAQTDELKAFVEENVTFDTILPDAPVVLGLSVWLWARMMCSWLVVWFFMWGQRCRDETGEGKTPAQRFADLLECFEGKAFTVTANDYFLAQRDAGWMVMYIPGLDHRCDHTSVICFMIKIMIMSINDDPRRESFVWLSRKEAYAADITYWSGNELQDCCA